MTDQNSGLRSSDGPHQYRYLSLERHEAIIVVTMDRPPVNAVNQEFYAEIRDLFSRADEIFGGSRVVVLKAAGKHFCAGNDLAEFMTLTPANSSGRMKLVREAFFAIYDCPLPTIAAIRGMAAGTGVAIAASCDLLICGQSAQIATPEVSVGIMGGAKHLRRLVPEQLMRRMYFTTDPIGAAELQRYGAVAAVVPDSQLDDAALALASRIAVHSQAALRQAKDSLNAIEPMDLKRAYELEQRATGRLVAHSDSREARSAALNKRLPDYSNE